MSRPVISGSDIRREQSVTDLIQSVTLEQTALSHILNAEGEKLQAVIQMPGVTLETLTAVNQSVKSMVDAVAKLETHLHNKLDLFGNTLLPISFTFYKRAGDTGAGVGGSLFTLSQAGVPMRTAISTAGGRVTFTCVEPGTYFLAEATPPRGYLPNPETYTVVVVRHGEITIDGVPAADFVVTNMPYASLTVMKVDDMDEPLAGVVFELTGHNGVVRKTTDEAGRAVFPRVVPGTYTLKETVWPVGYLPDTTLRGVVVDANGVMTIDGVATNSVTVENNVAIDIEVRFAFVDDEDASGNRPSSFVAHLYQNGVLHRSQEIPSATSGHLLFQSLRKYDDDGALFVYTVRTDAIPYYRTTINGYEIIHTIEVFDWIGKVVWFDSNNRNGHRPTQVTIRLLQDGAEIGQKIVTASTNWGFAFPDLQVFKPGGGEYVYQLQQNYLPWYRTGYPGRNVENTEILP